MKPNVFPYNVTPVSRLKSVQKMSLSMLPQYEASPSLNRGDQLNKLATSIVCSSTIFSISARLLDYGDDRSASIRGSPARALSQSVAIVGFQISGRQPNPMQQSAIDALLESSPDTRGSATSADQRNVAIVAPSSRRQRDSGLSMNVFEGTPGFSG